MKEKCIECVLCCCALVSLITTCAVVSILVYESIGFFALEEVNLFEFLTGTEWTPLFSKKEFGILPLVCGTLLITGIALIVAVPIGLGVAIYLYEFAPKWLRAMLKPILEILAGVPTILYGYFALFTITPIFQKFFVDMPGFNALSPGIVMGFMILPMIVSLSEEALSAVSPSLRDAACALGATRMTVTTTVVIPAAMSGIISSVILAMARAIGETMIVVIAAGQQPNLTLNPLNAVETMTAFIVQVSMGDIPHGSLEYKTVFAVGMMLFLITLLLNTVSLKLKAHSRRFAA